jgi:hypothetical protein
MGFDDRQTEPLIVVACLAVLCGCVAAPVGRSLGWGWGVATFGLPVVLCLLLTWLWRRTDRDQSA